MTKMHNPPGRPKALSSALLRLVDRLGRTITDLRVSVTDRCNYKCVYCRTGTEAGGSAELPLDAYLRMIRVFVGLGIRKVRITGGEPLLRRGIVGFVEQLATLRSEDISGDRNEPLDIAMTTNGHLLAEMAGPLARAGLSRITISMDAVEPAAFERMTRVPGSFSAVLAGLHAAKSSGLQPIKVNCVLLRSFNEEQVVPFARFAREEGVVVRFIEFMPLEEGQVWAPNVVVPLKEVEGILNRFRPLVKLPVTHPGETALRYTFDDGVGEIGVIAPVSQAFCGACSRIRLTAEGTVRTCLFSQTEHDLYSVLARGGTDDDLAACILRAVETKEARHHIGEPGFVKPSRSMVQIGG